MANEPTITVIGFVGSDAELKTTPTGISLASFTLASTPRKKKDGVWTDGETMWFRVLSWNLEAQGVASSVRKGDKVVVTGSFIVNTFKDKEGTERKSFEINADGVGIIPKRSAPVENYMEAFNDSEEAPW